MNSSFTCHFSRSRRAAGLLTVLFTSLPACGLFSIEPEEIDIADDEAGEAGDATDETGAFDSTSSEANTAGTDTTGDGDGDTSDATSDTAAESGTTGDTGTTSDTGSDTGDPTCSAPDSLVVGPNAVSIDPGSSMFAAACGGLGAETLYSFTAELAGSYSFELSGAEFAGGVLYLLDTQCAPIFGACELTIDLMLDETVFLVVDSDSGVGAAIVTITGP